MSFYYGITADSVSTLFGSVGTKNASGSSFDLSTYMSIRNGSYKKLVSAYYDETGKDNKLDVSTGTGVDSTKKLMSMESSADALKEAADDLFVSGKDSVFNKVEVKNADGTVSAEYDREAIYKKVDAFVKAYNDMIEEAGEAETESILKRTTSMIRDTEGYEKLLKKVGITIGSDNQLEVDEDDFMKADMSTVKSVFNGVGSLSYSTSANASYINYMADYEASKANTYNSYGSYNYNYNYGNIYNSLG
ncbi:MAG: hypothetical protein E7266_06165 [Lachnospiraceae bacterium]|nr:hypothetical protein [Lachnospiraceae bacterium]